MKKLFEHAAGLRIARRARIVMVALSALILGSQISQAEPAGGKLTPVLELFTSQGCSSCPPADRYLGKLQERGDLVTLSLPVDYWDYLGWKDTLARPENSVRQRLYAKMSKAGTVYTPQIVVNGITHAVGSRPGEVEQAIATAKAKLDARAVGVRVRMENKELVIEADAAKKPGKKATVWVALISKVKEINIKRGENSGRTVTYYNVLRDMKKVGVWTGDAARIQVPAANLLNDDTDTCAILIQEGVAGPILGAALMHPIGS